MTTMSKKEYNNFFEQNGFKLESNDPKVKLILLGTQIYLWDNKDECYELDASLSFFLKKYTEEYDYFLTMPYSSDLQKMMWENFHNSSDFNDIANKYDLTNGSVDFLKKTATIDIYRETRRDYLLNNKVKPIYLSRVFTNDTGFDINPKLGFWNGQIWSVTEKYARLEFNNIGEMLNGNRKRSPIAMLGQPDRQANPLERKLKEDDHIIFLKDDLGRLGFLSMENMNRLESIYSPVNVESYLDLK